MKKDKQLYGILEKYINTKRKAFLFNLLLKNKESNIRERYIENRASYLHANNLKRKVFKIFKNLSIYEKSGPDDQRLRERTDDAIRNYELDMKKQYDDLMELVLKAEDKLKHENRKKVQTKLQLDQIVLRGISALNLQALGLSQNTLTGIL
jgi:hypothetical protein